MSLKAYQRAQSATENPRDTEFRLFGAVTGALLDATEEPRHSPRLVEAIDWNRRMWTTLAADCSDDNNRLPVQVRAQIISLSIWVGKYSSQVIRNGASLEPLIEINRTIMQGLSARPEPSKAAS